MASASTTSPNEPQGPQFSPHSKAKGNNKNKISRRMASSGKSHVEFASVYSEKTRLKKCLIMIIVITSYRKTIY